MSYTSIENVRQYLVDSFPRATRVVDQPFTITGIDYQPFFGGSVEGDSLHVKSVQATELTRMIITFDVDRKSVSSNPLVPGSIVVASDSSLGRVYTENIDYIIDLGAGDIVRKEGGGLALNQTVTVWFLPYQLYTADIDFVVNGDVGQIKRLASGAIASEETIYLDYTPVLKPYNDEVISAAVTAANGLVQREVDPAGDFGADRTLQTAATFRALAIVCRTSAVRSLSLGNPRANSPLDWIKLADSFDNNADTMLRNFRPPFTNPHLPKNG